jgi:N-acetylglucosamine malate deacetylase 1
MINFKDQRVLIVAPHPDDEVFGAGGLIHRVKREGGKVYVLYITVGTTNDFSQKGISTGSERMRELESVADFLGFDGYRIALPGNEYHLRLDSVAQKDLIDEIERGKDISFQSIQPSFVVAPSVQDYNQDHRAVGMAVVTATRPAAHNEKPFQPLVLTYEMPYAAWNQENALANPNFLLELQEQDIDMKIRAVSMYKSQLKNEQNPLSCEAVKNLALLRGAQSGKPFAEGFFARRIFL